MAKAIEINPNHPVTSGLREHWQKIVALLLCKFGLDEVILTVEDLAHLNAMFPGELPCIMALDDAQGLHLKLVSETEGEALGRVHGGLPS